MLRVRPTLKAAFLRVDLNFVGGALHSVDDTPAVLYRPTGTIFFPWFWGHYLRVVQLPDKSPSECDGVLYAPFPNSTVVGQNEESRWYDRGDLHRDFGPAVCSQHYWYKYNRGVLAASDANTFEADAPCMPTVGAPCINDPKCALKCDPKCNSRVTCTHNCAKLVACTLVSVWGARDFLGSTVRVYHTCSGEVIECPVDARFRSERIYLEVYGKGAFGDRKWYEAHKWFEADRIRITDGDDSKWFTVFLIE
jgi:hypothetical protein